MSKNGINQVISAPLAGTHIQIIACAGSGKTEALARRVAHLLTKKIPPESIIAFTFTEKAAAELNNALLIAPNKHAASQFSEALDVYMSAPSTHTLFSF
jgi:superfamily I DNA/RNA helicase